MAGNRTGKAFSANGVNVESLVCLGPSELIDCGCDNPIAEYFKEEDELNVICGGREDKKDDEVNKNKNKGKIVIEEDDSIIEVSNTVVKTLSLSSSTPSFVNKRFTYISTLGAKLKPRPIVKYKTREDYNDFSHVNALTHMYCSYKADLFIFSRRMFQDEEYSKFFIYNRSERRVSTYSLPTKIITSVKNNNMQFYDEVQVTATHKNLIYFALNRYSKKTKKVFTQIIELEIDAK